MLTFLFWNMGGERKRDSPKHQAGENARVARLKAIAESLTRQHNVDVLMVTECPIAPLKLLAELNKSNRTLKGRQFREPDPRSFCDDILIFPRFSSSFLLLREESPRFTCRILRLPERDEIILCVAHWPSKLHRSDESQTLAATVYSSRIRRIEKKARHDRTIVVGDLNLNPFDAGMVGAEGLNASMSRHVALKETRGVDGEDYPFFYNPMWSHFGDSTHETHPPGSSEHEPPGTCYYKPAESRWYYWNMFDQVLLRPALLPFFRNRDLLIVVGDGTHSLLTKEGIPDRESFSDHLPILFRLNF